MQSNDSKKRKLSLNRFKNTTESDQEEVLKRRKAENTNKSTKLWVDCLDDYVKEKGLRSIEDVTCLDLPKNSRKLSYVDVRSQKTHL